MENLKKTPLCDIYKRYGGKMVDFCGWYLPVQFEGLIAEHEAVRNAAGLFDVSHMGEVEIKGKEALSLVQKLITNDASALKQNQVLYTLMCYENGGIVDDLLVYKFDDDYFYLVINAANIDKDYEWIERNSKDYDVSVKNISDSIAEVALQGPKAQEILQKLTNIDLNEIGFFYCMRDVVVDGVKCLISRTGYTGEDGFEIYSNNENVVKLWNKILETGESLGIKPAGLGCRDTLRFEASLPLYGNEISQEVTPIEAGLGFFVKLDKGDFNGREVIEKQKKEGTPRKLVGFEMIGRGIPRHGYEVTVEGNQIGFVTTGYFSPTLKKNIGLALIKTEFAALDNEIEIKIRNKSIKAKIIYKKFYNKKYKK